MKQPAFIGIPLTGLASAHSRRKFGCGTSIRRSSRHPAATHKSSSSAGPRIHRGPGERRHVRAIEGKGDFKAQATQVFENLKGAVQAAGGTLADVAKINIYVTDVANLAAVADVRRQYVAVNPPACTFVQVVSLARPEFLLEIEAIAAVD